MHSPEPAPLVIVGGGLAGLSLAWRLQTGGWTRTRRLVILEARTTYQHDRCWSFWAQEPDLVAWCRAAGLIRAEWSAFQVAHGADTVVCRDGPPYLSVAAGEFYRAALQRLEADPAVELCLGTPVTAVIPALGDAPVRIETAGDRIPAARVVITHPVGHMENTQPPGLFQHFLGQTVETASPVFDPGTATLMDMRPDEMGQFRFVYVLPTAPDRALVEATWFSPTPLPASAYRAAIAAYLAPAPFTVLDEEQGCLPMHNAPLPRLRPPLYALGSWAGALKPGTGYAFAAIQRDAEALTRHLLTGSPLPPPPPRLPRWLDGVMLSVLRRHPDVAPALFLALFRRCPTQTVVDFLSEHASLPQILRVVTALPHKGLLLRHTLAGRRAE